MSLSEAAPSRLPRFGRNELGRDLAVGDVHGCLSLLDQALASIGFDSGRDRLFCLGDLVDRGPDSARVLEWLGRPWLRSVCGNHDFMAWRSALGNPFPHVVHAEHGGEWLGALPPAERRAIGERLRELPLAIEVDTALGPVGLVHADCPFDDWDEMRRVRWDRIDPAGPLGSACMWSVERHSRQYKGLVKNVRAVVHGHMTVRSAQVLGNAHFIDTGAHMPGGAFTFLDLATLKTLRGPQTFPLPRRAG